MFRAILLCVLMMIASVLALVFAPVIDSPRQVDLEALIPRQFGDWKMDEAEGVRVVSPSEEAFLQSWYSQTLSRTYVDSAGHRMMLSLAYGADQSHDNQIHKPEVCYPAQGFRLVSTENVVIQADGYTLPSKRVVAQLGERLEPVTYWIRLGDSLVRGAIEQNLARISYGLKGHLPDGLLFRVSEINSNTQSSFAVQDKFIADLLTALSFEERRMLIGSLAGSDHK